MTLPQKSINEQYPKRATRWQLRTRTLDFDRQPKLMGIVNVTPDSFSDGGQYADPQRAIEHGLKLAEDGADILDVGGESTRPGSDAVGLSEELRRVVQVIQGLAQTIATPISIDTSKAKVAEEAIAAGAEIINDVTGLEADPEMPRIAAASQAGICAMHMRGTPKTMLDPENLDYLDVVEDVMGYLRARHQKLIEHGISHDRICLDPGIGFAKSHQQNLTVLAEMGRFHALGAPLLVGPSKKGFLAKILGNAELDRTSATVGVALRLASLGVHVIRVHDVLSVRQAMLSFAASGGIDGQVLQLPD